MNKPELIASIAEKTGVTKVDAEKVPDGFIETVEEVLKSGNDVRLIGFGIFCTAKREATTGRNPRTGETMQIPDRITPKFKQGKQLKEKLAK